MAFTYVKKLPVMTFREKLIYALLFGGSLFFLLRYVVWWFQPAHIATNFYQLSIPLRDTVNIGLFAFLSFVVFLGPFQRFVAWFALWFMAKPALLTPQKGLKVAFLTCYVPGKEPLDMLETTLKAMVRVRYPHHTWVLDEGNNRDVKILCNRLGVKHFSRFGVKKYNQVSGKFRTKTKAGNHNAWLDKHENDYDIVAQIDMDHVPEPDFLDRTLGYFRDSRVGVVAMPQLYKNTSNWIARGAAEQAYFFHGPIQKGFYGCDMPFLIGTSHIYRTKAMKNIGGYAPTIVEDHLTGMRIYAKGWKGVFVPEVLAQGEGPTNWVDYFNQQLRWSYGLFEILFKYTPKIIWKLNWKQKINYGLSQLYYFTGVAVFLGTLLTILYLAFGIRAASMSLTSWLFFATPPFLLAQAIQLYSHRFSIDPAKEPIYGAIGNFMNLAANLIYSLALVKFLTGQVMRYQVTQKGSAAKSQRVSLTAFTPHILLLLTTLWSLGMSFIYGNTAIQLRFWAVFTVGSLGACIFSLYYVGLQYWLKSHQLALRALRLGFRFSVATVIVVALSLGFTKKSEIASAFNLSYREAFEIDVPVAGKIVALNEGALVGISLYEYDDRLMLEKVEKETGLEFAVVGYYQSWKGEHNLFPSSWARSISEKGAIPLITWEPWRPIGGFDRSQTLVDQPEFRLSNITAGHFDDYLRLYAADVKKYRKPVMIRFAHEMNGNWYPWGSTLNTPAEYNAAWRYVHEVFDAVGATNVTWVWSPNEVYKERSVQYASEIEQFYPGDDYVDWVGVSSFNWAGFYKQNTWRSPESLFEPTMKVLRILNKPILITETASAEIVKDRDSKARWIKELSAYLKDHPEIDGVVWFNAVDNGIDWTIGSSESSQEAFMSSFGDDYFYPDIN